MGAANSSQQSPRSVAMENPLPASVIDISDDVVKRLKQGISKQQARESTADSSSASSSEPPPSPPKSVPRKVAKVPAPAAPAASSQPTIIYPSPTPIYVTGGHTITAADVRRQMEGELKNNDELWRQRMTKLEETLKKTNSIMESEYETALEDVRKRFVTSSPLHQPPPCGDLKKQLLACYRNSPGETLRCTQDVNAFRNCVESHRIKKLEAAEPVKAEAKPTTLAKAG